MKKLLPLLQKDLLQEEWMEKWKYGKKARKTPLNLLNKKLIMELVQMKIT